MSKTHKSRVNEWCQRHPDFGKPQYSTEEANGGFKCTLTFGEHRFVSKTCPSKKEAEHLAASMALQKLEGMARQRQLGPVAVPSPAADSSLPHLPDLLPVEPHNTSQHNPHSLQSHAQQFTSVVQNQGPHTPTPAPLVGQSLLTERSFGRQTTVALPHHPSQMGSPELRSAGTATHQPTAHQHSLAPTPHVHGPQHFTSPPRQFNLPSSRDHTAAMPPSPAAHVYNTQLQQTTNSPALQLPTSQQFVAPPTSQHFVAPPISQQFVAPLSSQQFVAPPSSQQFVAPPISQQQFASVAHPSLLPTVSHASASGPTPSASQGLPPDPVTELEQLCTVRGWPAPQYQFWEKRRTFHQVSVACGPHEPFCISNGQFGSVDIARRMVAQQALQNLSAPAHSPFSSRGGSGEPTVGALAVPASREEDSRTHQLERLCSESNLPQPQIEINQAVKEGYGTGVVALVTVGQERFISAVEADQHNACENALEKALAQLAQRTSSCTDGPAKQPGEDSAETALGAKQLRYKNDLQELLQKRGFPLPTYTCRETNGGFIATVSFVAARKGDADKRQDFSLSEPQPTKKKAEQAVAKRALEWLSTRPQ